MVQETHTGQVSQQQLSEFLGVTPKTIRAWERQGCPIEEKAKRGKPSRYSVSAVVEWRIDQARLAASGDLAAMDQDEARRRKLAAEAALAELDLARQRDEVVSIDVVAKDLSAALSSCRAKLLQVGAKVAPQVDLAPDAASMKEMIDDAIYEALDDISSGSLEYMGSADDAMEASEADGYVIGDAPAAEADPERMG